MKSPRIKKVESLVQKIAAETLRRELGPESAVVTVTSVEVSPDMRHATCWVGIIGRPDIQEKLYERTVNLRGVIQFALAGNRKALAGI